MEALVKFGKYTTHLSYHIKEPPGLRKADMVKLTTILQLCPNIEDLMLSQGWQLPVDLPASTIAALYEVVASLPKLRRYWGIFGDRPSARQRIPAPTRHLGMTHIAAPAGYIDIDVILQFKYLTHFVIYFSEGWLIRVNLTKWIARGDMDLWEFSERVTIAQQRKLFAHRFHVVLELTFNFFVRRIREP